MARKRITPKPKSKLNKSSSDIGTPKRSSGPGTPKRSSGPATPTRSTRASMIETPKQDSRKSKLLQKSKIKSNEKKKRKRQPMPMRVGSKTFAISVKILREIKHYQMSTGNLIPKLPFSRLVQEIMSSYIPEGRRVQRIALEALQEAAESYLVQYFEDSYVCALHARRVTLIPRDMDVIKRLRGSF